LFLKFLGVWHITPRRMLYTFRYRLGRGAYIIHRLGGREPRDTGQLDAEEDDNFLLSDVDSCLPVHKA